MQRPAFSKSWHPFDACELPPAPPLDDQHFRTERVELNGLGCVEVLRPVADAYRPESELAPALILVPGFCTHGRTWLRQLPLGALADVHVPLHAPLYAQDENGLHAFARALEEYIRACGLDQRPGGVVLMGSSMGGAVAMTVALRKRLPLRGLILVGTFAHRKQLDIFRRNAWPLSWLIPSFLVPRVGRMLVSYTKWFDEFDAEEMGYISHGMHVPSQHYFVRAARAITGQRLLEDVHAIDVPTLVLHGTHDHVLAHSAGEELAQRIPGACFHSVADGGHAFFFTHHREVNAAAACFLQKLCPELKAPQALAAE